MAEKRIQKQARQFYDKVGWQTVDNHLFQNAQFEDLRSVISEYIHRCHLRVNRYLRSIGEFMLDAGSGPVQYPEYLTDSSGYEYRVYLDISLTALLEARDRLKGHGLYVLADIANLPFPMEIFVWRSVNERFLHALNYLWLGGKWWLKFLYWLEDRFPHYLGENGAYPLIVLEKHGAIK